MEYRLEIERTEAGVHGYYSVWENKDAHTWEIVAHPTYYRIYKNSLKIIEFEEFNDLSWARKMTSIGEIVAVD